MNAFLLINIMDIQWSDCYNLSNQINIILFNGKINLQYTFPVIHHGIILFAHAQSLSNGYKNKKERSTITAHRGKKKTHPRARQDCVFPGSDLIQAHKLYGRVSLSQLIQQFSEFKHSIVVFWCIWACVRCLLWSTLDYLWNL